MSSSGLRRENKSNGRGRYQRGYNDGVGRESDARAPNHHSQTLNPRAASFQMPVATRQEPPKEPPNVQHRPQHQGDRGMCYNDLVYYNGGYGGYGGDAYDAAYSGDGLEQEYQNQVSWNAYYEYPDAYGYAQYYNAGPYASPVVAPFGDENYNPYSNAESTYTPRKGRGQLGRPFGQNARFEQKAGDRFEKGSSEDKNYKFTGNSVRANRSRGRFHEPQSRSNAERNRSREESVREHDTTNDRRSNKPYKGRGSFYEATSAQNSVERSNGASSQKQRPSVSIQPPPTNAETTSRERSDSATTSDLSEHGTGPPKKTIYENSTKSLPKSSDDSVKNSAKYTQRNGVQFITKNSSSQHDTKGTNSKTDHRGSATKGYDEHGGTTGTMRFFEGGDTKSQKPKPGISFIENGKFVMNEAIETQRGRLIEELMNQTYECMVCCDVVRRDVAVWSCGECYHVFHMYCIKKWARSPSALVEGTENGWRCPACQNVSVKVPSQYRCFCAKQREPQFSHYETPHSCGEVCGRARRDEHCTHACNILCHPGPCPSCNASVARRCHCAKLSKVVKCSQAADVKCEEKCAKLLLCVRHRCDQVCHKDACKPCDESVEQVCYCGKNNRKVTCGSEESCTESYVCGVICGRDLSCGKHKCVKVCHIGPCDDCALSPSVVDRCPCGKSALDDLPHADKRQSCADPVPVCGEICDKELKCGPEAKRHRCSRPCHGGPCNVCEEGITPVTCRCQCVVKEMTCLEAQKYLEGQVLLCTRKCPKKRQCGQHKCQQKCCVDKEHVCARTCGRKMSCGLHRCEEQCHRGQCHTCWNVNFDEVTCHCGAAVLDPPVACGTRPPECSQPCSRPQACQHPVRHTCHSDEVCPPCAELTTKTCHGGHEQRHNIPCHISDVSCGLRCRKPLPCRQHLCAKICHKDACLAEGGVCQQACQRVREWCDHVCAAPCHVGKPCPETTCRAKIAVKCPCGARSEMSVCGLGRGDAPGKIYQQMTNSAMVGKILYVGNGQSVDINALNAAKRTRQLECDDQCAKIERNRRIALALQIENPDLSDKLGTPNYTEFLKEFARDNPGFVADIERALAELVHTAKSSKYLNRSHAFKPMRREQRRLIHELAEFYGCKTQSYDYEPVKSVVATAYKDKCWMPNMTLTVAIRRETQPSAPLPIPHNSTEREIRAKSIASRQSTSVLKSEDSTKRKSKPKFIDYFDMNDDSS